MLEILTAQNVPVKLCKTCTDGRGITGLPLIDGVEIGTLVELAEWTLSADKVLTFNNNPIKILFSYGRGFSIKFTCAVADRHGNNTAGITLMFSSIRARIIAATTGCLIVALLLNTIINFQVTRQITSSRSAIF